MAYDDPPFREEADFRTMPAYQPGGYRAGQFDGDGTATVPPAVLDDVFDDPTDGTPGRDRLAIHWVWEVLLLLGVAALGYLLWQADPDALRGDRLSQLLVQVAGYGLLALGAGVSLRASAPNLAVGPVAVAAGLYFAQQGADGVVTPTVVALLWAVVLGAALAMLVAVFHVPGWAASLAAAAAAVVWIHNQPAFVPLAGEYDPTSHAALLFVAVAAVGILGGLIGTLKPVRRAVGRFRPIGDPASRRGPLAAAVTSGALILSMTFAVVAGVLLTAGQGVPVEARSGVYWLELTVLAMGIALVGGTSAYGRRGGVFGTTLAVVAVVLFNEYQQVQGWQISLLALAAVAVAGGLVVTRMVETFGRPPSAGADDEWAAAQPSTGLSGIRTPAAEGWGASAADSWSSALPAQPAPGTAERWDEGRWSR